MLNKLTKEQEDLMVDVRDYWINKLISCSNTINKEKATASINWLYTLSKLSPPKRIIFTESPMGCQYAYNKLLNVNNDKNHKMVYASFALYGSISDYGWVAFYDYFTKIGTLNNYNFNKYKELLESNIYDMIQLKDVCIVSNMPKIIKRDGVRLHSSNSAAIEFNDGYKLFYWKGLNVPEQWVMSPSLLTRDDVLKETNAEKRRCLTEILGWDKYLSLLGDIKVIDEDTDGEGNTMTLYQSLFKESLIGENVQYLKVICPSTKREYILCPVNQKSKNVWEAKASMFNNEGIYVRHGDVGIIHLEENLKNLKLMES